jgi:hypothetical protein
MARTLVQFTEKQLTELEALSGAGVQMERIAAYFELKNKKTLERMQKRDKRVKVAIEKGRAIAEASVTKTAFDMATSGKHPVMTIFWLKTRAKWKEVNHHKHEGDGVAVVSFADLVKEANRKTRAVKPRRKASNKVSK